MLKHEKYPQHVFSTKGYDIMKSDDGTMYIKQGAAFVDECKDLDDGIAKIESYQNK